MKTDSIGDSIDLSIQSMINNIMRKELFKQKKKPGDERLAIDIRYTHAEAFLNYETSYVAKHILDQGKQATCNTKIDSNAMYKVMYSIGIVTQQNNDYTKGRVYGR